MADLSAAGTHRVLPAHRTSADAEATRSAVVAMVFASTLAVLVVGPPLLKQPFGPYPLLTQGMVLDLLTPAVLIPAGWWLFRRASDGQPTILTWAFIALAALMIEGQAMHFAANAIGEHLGSASPDAGRLTHDLDEVLSHVIWHAALVGLSLVLVAAGWHRTSQRVAPAALAASAGAAVIFGATFFLMVVEGGTTIIGVPAAVLIAGIGLVALGDRRMRAGAASVFVFGYAVAGLLFLAWAMMNGWALPEFSDVGLL